jgi:cation diffusion facilitator CzcD-associated flavoprotein CzcO
VKPFPHHQIAIIGAGFSGVGAAIRLKQRGYHDLVVLERADEVGGTWRDNTYPGCACDVETHLYSFSFAPNPDWSEMYAHQPEILAYLKHVVARYQLRQSIRFNHAVVAAAWDTQANHWRIETTGGTFTAHFLIAGYGPLAEPRLPDIPGLATFNGRYFHSARWDHSHNLQGERVAVIGTGASAVQFIPQIQPQVARLDVFQRTPAWVVPRLNRQITQHERQRFRRIPLARDRGVWILSSQGRSNCCANSALASGKPGC